MASGAYRFIANIYAYLLLIAEFLTDKIFGYLYFEKSEKLTPIKNAILLESATSIAAKIRNRQVRSEDVVKMFIDRIKEVNITLNAMVDTRFEDAIREAQAVDKLIATGAKNEQQLQDEFPFLGVPYTTKDCWSVKGLHQTGGLVSRKNVISEVDAPVIDIMRNAGAILLGLTNTPELCMWWECHNRVYGRTKNSYDTTRTPGGSSGGEGSIISSAASVFGIGTDIGGSIRIPCFFSGIFGHKPSIGSVPLDGMIPTPVGELRNYNTVGPMCRYASDLIPMFKVLSRDTGLNLKLDTPVDLKKLRIFYMEDDSGSPLASKVHPEIKSSIRKVINYFEKAHGVKAQKVNIREFYYSIHIYGSKLAEGASASFSALLGNGKGEINAIAEFIKWCFFSSDFTLPGIYFAAYEKIMNRDPEFVRDCDSKLTNLKKTLQDLLGSDGIFLYPTNPRLAPYHNQTLFHPVDWSYTSIFNVLGLPSTQCPLGLSTEGIPLGVQVIGNVYHDHNTLAMALELEKAFGGWVPPCPIP